jgi:hypothetical protein
LQQLDVEPISQVAVILLGGSCADAHLGLRLFPLYEQPPAPLKIPRDPKLAGERSVYAF